MTPKEKAQEILGKMNVIHYTKLASGSELPVSMYDDQIKQCALIAVDEMLNEYRQNCTFAQLEWVEYRIAFLEEVKMELIKI